MIEVIKNQWVIVLTILFLFIERGQYFVYHDARSLEHSCNLKKIKMNGNLEAAEGRGVRSKPGSKDLIGSYKAED